MTSDNGLSGKVAVVTGGASGIGAACAARLASSGARVAILDCDARAGGELSRRLPQSEFFGLNVSNAAQVEQVFTQIREHCGAPVLLVNNAGIVKYGSLTETSEEVWDEVLNVNLKSAYLCSRQAIPDMLRNGSGAIVNVSSVQAFVSECRVAAYATSKTALLGLTRTTAIDYAPAIRCNAVCPGSVDTPMLQRFTQGSEEKMEGCRRMHLLDRIAAPEEIAELIAFLLSDASAFITGQAIRIDGGIGAWIGPRPPSA
jgi:NAD(P)-dependent dehydrogenase (short-subunit alcohol dehydrogenase family)